MTSLGYNSKTEITKSWTKKIQFLEGIMTISRKGATICENFFFFKEISQNLRRAELKYLRFA